MTFFPSYKLPLIFDRTVENSLLGLFVTRLWGYKENIFKGTGGESPAAFHSTNDIVHLMYIL